MVRHSTYVLAGLVRAGGNNESCFFLPWRDTLILHNMHPVDQDNYTPFPPKDAKVRLSTHFPNTLVVSNTGNVLSRAKALTELLVCK